MNTSVFIHFSLSLKKPRHYGVLLEEQLERHEKSGQHKNSTIR